MEAEAVNQTRHHQHGKAMNDGLPSPVVRVDRLTLEDKVEMRHLKDSCVVTALGMDELTETQDTAPNAQEAPSKLTNETVVRSVYSDQHEIIRSINRLYLKTGIECDPTYSKGIFYRGADIAEPRLKFDLFPQTEDTVQASAETLPLADASLQNLMFDPPFMAGFTKPKPTGLMGNRFHGFRYVPDLWRWYDVCLKEFYRVLKPKGFLVFKCQDTVSSGKNWFTHVYVMNRASAAGFYPKDLFVLTAKNRIIGHNHGNQKHARKFHSYFWVFEKTSGKVDYGITHTDGE